MSSYQTSILLLEHANELLDSDMKKMDLHFSFMIFSGIFLIMYIRVNHQQFVYNRSYHVKPPIHQHACQLFVYPSFVYNLLSRSLRILADGRVAFLINFFFTFYREQTSEPNDFRERRGLLYRLGHI